MSDLIHLCRVYEFQAPSPDAAFLVDRLWPRGVGRERLAGVTWLKEAAPSHELRRWFHANPERWDDLAVRYRDELVRQDGWLPLLAPLGQRRAITLLYGSRDTRRNHAVALRDFLAERMAASGRG